MSLLEQSTKLLQQQLLTENQPYTYKLLSRELDIHVDDAKRLLYSFYLKNKDLISANFVIVGRLKDFNGLNIKITEDLEEQNQFEEVKSIAVYSLAPKNSNINEVVKLVQNKLNKIEVTDEKLKIWGVTKGPEIVKSTLPRVSPQARSAVGAQTLNTPSLKKADIPVDSEQSTKPSSSSSSVSNSNKSDMRKEKEEPYMGSLAARMLARNKRPAESENTAKKSNQPTFGRSATENTSNSKKEEASNSRRSQTDPAANKATETVEISEDEKEIPVKKYAARAAQVKKAQPVVEAPPRKKTAKELELEGLFDSDEEIEEVEPKETGREEKEESLTKDELDELEELDEFIESERVTTPEKEDSMAIDNVEGVQEMEKEDISKDESVKQYYDEDGFLVTEKKAQSKLTPKPRAKSTVKADIKSDENKIESKKRSAASPATLSGSNKKSKTSTGGGKQSSLLSFFGKKAK